MPLVNVMVNGRAYTIACDDGEEDHLRDLAKHVDEKVRELLGSVGQVGDQRLLLMAAVLITDEYFEAASRLETTSQKLGELAGRQDEENVNLVDSEQTAAASLEAAANRLEDLSAKLARA
ncbi:MAG: cell division protein ZapA [Proteobacteria bacterium]|nr:cell division protein ZapA [Pseudomonadota bacterium]